MTHGKIADMVEKLEQAEIREREAKHLHELAIGKAAELQRQLSEANADAGKAGIAFSKAQKEAQLAKKELEEFVSENFHRKRKRYAFYETISKPGPIDVTGKNIEIKTDIIAVELDTFGLIAMDKERARHFFGSGAQFLGSTEGETIQEAWNAWRRNRLPSPIRPVKVTAFLISDNDDQKVWRVKYHFEEGK